MCSNFSTVHLTQISQKSSSLGLSLNFYVATATTTTTGDPNYLDLRFQNALCGFVFHDPFHSATFRWRNPAPLESA